MVIDIIVIIIAGLCLIVILAMVIRKFPLLSAIDTKTVPQEKEKKVKNVLLEQRLKRKVTRLGIRVKQKLSPVLGHVSGQLKSQYHKITDLEKKYREKRNEAPLTLEEKDEAAQKIKILLKEAEEFLNQEEFKKGEAKCIEVLSFDKNNLEAYHLLADIYLGSKDYEHAKEIFSFLIKLNEKDDRAFSGLGLIASSLGNLQEAKDDFLTSINLNNKTAAYQIDLARVYQALGKTDKALDCCQEALKLEPNNPKILHNLIQICLEAKNKGLALITFDKLKEANPENQKLDELKKQIDAL